MAIRCTNLILLTIIASISSALRPNMIIFLADDVGYGDLKSYGHPTQEWGPIDDLAEEGMKFTSLYSTSSLCSPSRAALLTGRLPIRIGVYGKLMNFYLQSPNGLPKDEITLPEILRDVGYATGMVGKWHLGINDYTPMSGVHLPHYHGFDWVGTNLPYTNVWECDETKRHMDAPDPFNCFMYNNETIIQQPFSHQHLTKTFVDEVSTFIKQQTEKDKPFFLYLSFVHNHVAMFTGKDTKFTSRRGIYGAGIRELSWGVGEIMKKIKSLGIDNNTLIFFTSDNGGHIELCSEGGNNGILKGGKANYYEGGIRVPGILRWPGQISAGTINSNIVSQMDTFTTFVNLAGGKAPSDRVIDGRDITQQIFGSLKLKNETKTEKRILFFYCNDMLFAVRYGSYKVHFYTMPVKSKEEYTDTCGEGGFPSTMYFNCLYCPSDCVIKHDPPLIFNVDADPGEEYQLDPALHKLLLLEVKYLLEKHNSGWIKGEDLLSAYNQPSQPCCDSSKPSCSCNYP
ncbi:arylsulfatase-like [Amphiura filiformis]|uniref:arylsulfatase-like n=1 Tax=Amphiura filiformis TaxID=82378 RepID=UPI003B217E1B